MYAERDIFGPASLSIVATRSSDKVSDVLDFILHLYYYGRISARCGASVDRNKTLSASQSKTSRTPPAARGPKAVLRLPDVVALKRTSWPLNQRRLPTRQASATIRNYQGKLAMVKSGRIR
jgi:hypothetical protein